PIRPPHGAPRPALPGSVLVRDLDRAGDRPPGPCGDRRRDRPSPGHVRAGSRPRGPGRRGRGGPMNNDRAWGVARIAGIEIRIHLSWIPALALVTIFVGLAPYGPL